MTDATFKKVYQALITILLIFASAALVWVIFIYALKWLAPIISAFLLSLICEPMVGFLTARFKMSRKIAAAVTMLFTIIIIGTAIFAMARGIAHELGTLSDSVPTIMAQLKQRIDELAKVLPFDAKNLDISIESLTKFVTSNISSISRGAFSIAGNIFKSLPNVIFSTIVFFLTSYFLIADRARIYTFVKNQFSNSAVKNFISVRGYLFKALFSYIKAMCIVMCITFVELLIGFSIIKVEYALIVALLVAIVDALPILGTGTILIPWAILAAIGGDYRMALSLMIIYLVILVVRQTIEPRIVSHQIGLYPLVTIVCMYVGLQVFGFTGMVLFPITALIIINMQKTGIVKVWK